jgi:hypothetical protein
MEFRALPIAADDGLPQRFTVSVSGRSYDVTAYAQIDASAEDPPERVYDLAPPERPGAPTAPPGFVVLRVDRRDSGGRTTILLRKLVVDPTLVHEAQELSIVLKEARVARGNLNGRGRLGSRLVIGVAPRWE